MSRRVLGSFALAVVTLGVAVPGAAAASRPDGETAIGAQAIAVLDGSGAKGIVSVPDGEGAASEVTFTLIGMKAGARHRLQFSDRTCGQSGGQRWATFPSWFEANSRGQRSATQELDLGGELLGSVQSVHVQVKRDGSYHRVACARLRMYDVIGQFPTTTTLRQRSAAPPPIAHADTSLTIFREDGVKGIIVANTDGDIHFRVRAVVTGLAASEDYSLIGGIADCAEAWSSSDRSAKLSVHANGRGAIISDKATPKLIVSSLGDFDGDGDVDGADFLAWRIKRASGQSVGCYEVDARLSKHQS